jgi:hypothetical protein
MANLYVFHQGPGEKNMPSISVSPTSFPLGVATPFTLTGTGTSWTGTTKPTVTGGTNAFISNILVSGQVITGTLNPGSATGILTMGDSTDSATAYVTAATNVINNAVWHGDRLTYGQNGSNPGTTSATRLAVVLNALGPTWQGTNYGNSGHTITQMISELGSHVNGLYNGTKQNNYLIAQGGHNDIVQGADASTVISRIQTYCSTALAANPWKIIWSTEPPAGDPGVYPYNFDSTRDAVNSYVRQNWQSLGIAALSDFALDFQMGLDGCEYNSTYYGNSDFTHPTDVGYTIWGSFDLGAVNSLRGSFPRMLTQGLTQGLGDGHLWYSVFDGTNWSADRQIQPLGISGSPSAVAWAGGITVFHQGDNGTLWYSYSADAKNWSADTLVPNVSMSESPSAVVYNGKLYVFHQGLGGGHLWYSVFDGTNWSADRQIQPLGISGSPSAIAWAGGITIFHQGQGDNGQLWYTYSGDGTNWGQDTLVRNVAMSNSPSAAVY